ncbi:A-kinase anchor protein 7 isoform X1, partial [Tachysurus ichikawai]
AALAIEEMESMLTSLVGGRSLVLPFRGIGHFKQEVAFIHIEEGEHISTLTHIAALSASQLFHGFEILLHHPDLYLVHCANGVTPPPTSVLYSCNQSRFQP